VSIVVSILMLHDMTVTIGFALAVGVRIDENTTAKIGVQAGDFEGSRG
jgi:hypothetical protein